MTLISLTKSDKQQPASSRLKYEYDRAFRLLQAVLLFVSNNPEMYL